MRWNTHRRITLEVCRYYGLQNAREIAEASILPDKQPDYYWVYRRRRARRRRVPHHDAYAVDFAFKYLKEARKAYLKGFSFEGPLGRALHYIQDFVVDPTSKLWIFSYRSDEAHKDREDGLEKYPVPEEQIRLAEERTCYPHDFKTTVFSFGRRKEPGEIMELATYLTSLAIKLVVKPDKPPNLTEEYRKNLRLHVALILLPWVLPLIVADVSAAVFSALASLAIHKLNFRYWRWKTDYEWFNG